MGASRQITGDYAMQSKWIERLSDDELEARIAETEELLRWGSKRIEQHYDMRILLMLLRDERDARAEDEQCMACLDEQVCDRCARIEDCE